MEKFVGQNTGPNPHNDNYILEESKEELEILERAIAENWTISKLLLEFPSELEIIIGSNCSGVNVARLDSMQVTEYSW